MKLSRHRRFLTAIKDFEQKLQTLEESSVPFDQKWQEASLLVQNILTQGEYEIYSHFENKQKALISIKSRSFVMDQILKPIFNFIKNVKKITCSLSLIGVGGYGRSELAPYSDLDFMILWHEEGPEQREFLTIFLQIIWQTGKKISHASRSIEDCLKAIDEDHTVLTAFLDSRFICGDLKLYKDFNITIQERLSSLPYNFIEAKFIEQKKRYEQFGDSKYVLEPNVKQGVGGLRDLQFLLWIVRYYYKIHSFSDLVKLGILSKREALHLEKSYNFLWAVRCHLHYLEKRGEERLTFDRQQDISLKMRYKNRSNIRAVERFMKHYYLIIKEVDASVKLFKALLQSDISPKKNISKNISYIYVQEGDWINIKEDTLFLRDEAEFFHIFILAKRLNLEVHPHVLRLMSQHSIFLDESFRKNNDANRLFLKILTTPQNLENNLRILNETGVLGKFIPDFGRVIALMQYDTYHTYTVDEHTIIAMGLLSQIEQGLLQEAFPHAYQVMQTLSQKEVLYLGLFLHDIAKGRGGDHSVLGEEIALHLGKRLGLNEEKTKTAAWLVRNHLGMSRFAFKRDLSDPKTIQDFMILVETHERLKLLYLLTICDIRAVGSHIWNSWKAQLLEQLYKATEEGLLGQGKTQDSDTRILWTKKQLKENLGVKWPDQFFETYVERGTPAYWLAFSLEDLKEHAELYLKRSLKPHSVQVVLRENKQSNLHEVLVILDDDIGIFSKIAAALTFEGLNIIDARTFSLRDHTGLNVYSFSLPEWAKFIHPKSLEKSLYKTILRFLEPGFVCGEALKQKYRFQFKGHRSFQVSPYVVVDNEASHTATVFEVLSLDRPGLLFDITRIFYELNLSIVLSKVATYGEKVVDIFYIKDRFGLKIYNSETLQLIQQKILESIRSLS
jgi:[protein-PII] uridylyltransferase